MGQRKKQAGKFFRKIFLLTGFVTFLLLVMIGIYPVRGNGNYPMLKDGDLAITQKIGTYQIGDLVSYRRNGKRYFARIIGTEGDSVSISGGRLLVNGMVPAEEVFYSTTDTEKQVHYPLTVSTENVFLLNDFREDEQDSRVFGTIPISDLDGKVIFLFRRRQF